MKRLVVVGALVFAACFIPTLEELEAERLRTCDASHACLTGYACVDGVCRSKTSAECTAAETRVCGSMTGECKTGIQRCDGGVFGGCEGAIGPTAEACDGKDNDCNDRIDDDAPTTACELQVGVCALKKRVCVGGVAEPMCSQVSYGSTFEPTETRCDGQDNDCDGLTDEMLPPTNCELTLGVCMGAQRSCTAGKYPVCTASVYLARHAAFEALETRCDGLDNDCDGLVDRSVDRMVSDAGTLTSRNVAIAALQSGDVLTVYESGTRILTRFVRSDETVSPARYPSTSVATAVTRAEKPALAVKGATAFQAWFEELTGPVFRLVVSNVGPNGEAQVAGQASVFPFSSQTGPGQSLVMSAAGEALVIVFASYDAATATGPTTVRLASCPFDLATSCRLESLGAGKNPALLVDGTSAFVAFETSSGLTLSSLRVLANGTVTVAATVPFGKPGDHDPTLAGIAADLSLYSVDDAVTPAALSRRTGDCSMTCPVTSFSLSASLLTFDAAPSEFSIHRFSNNEVLAWEDGAVGARQAKVVNLTSLVSKSLGAVSHRPVALRSATGTTVYFDTEGGTGTGANSIVARRLCGP